MSGRYIVVGGKKYLIGHSFGCSKVYEEPNRDEFQATIEGTPLTRNLQTDIFYYVEDGDKKAVCHVGLQTTPGLFREMEDLPDEEFTIDGMEGGKVVYIDHEQPEKDVSSISIEGALEELAKQIERDLKMMGFAEGQAIDFQKLFELGHFVKVLSVKHGVIISLETADEDDGDEISLRLVVDEIPQTIDLEAIVGSEIDKGHLAILKASLEMVFTNNPQEAAALLMGFKSLPEIYMDNVFVRQLPFTPVFAGHKLKDGVIHMLVEPTYEMPDIELSWDPGYLRFLSTRPVEERLEAGEYLARLMREVQSENMSDCLHRMKELEAGERKGWARLDRNYSLRFEPVRDPDKLSFRVYRVPVPKEIVLEGDFPPEDRGMIVDMLATSMRRGEVVMGELYKATARIKAHYEGEGYKIKELSREIAHDGKLYVNISLRRWDEIYKVEVLGEEDSDDKRTEREKLIRDVMMEYEGRFITDEDLEAVRRKLSRGLSRSDVKEIISTDPKTLRTKVVFVAATGKPVRQVGGGGGFGEDGMAISGRFSMLDNGHGTSYSISYTNMMRWRFFKDWDVKDIMHQSLRLGFNTTTGPNSRVGVVVYGSIRSDAKDSIARAGVDVTYRHYFMNDKVELSIGGEVEFVKVPEDYAGYDNLKDGMSARVNPHAGICYREGDLSVCFDTKLTTIATTYSRNKVFVSYSVPLGEGNSPYITMKASGGIMLGDVPELEQFHSLSTGLPFSLSLTEGAISYGNYFAGASAELAWKINSWLAIKPVVAMASVVGEYAKAVVGSCVALGPMEFCAGYRQGLANVKSGFEFSIASVSGFDLPEQVKYFFEQAFLRSYMED